MDVAATTLVVNASFAAPFSVRVFAIDPVTPQARVPFSSLTDIPPSDTTAPDGSDPDHRLLQDD